MTIERVMESLSLIGGCTADELAKYTLLVSKNIACYSYLDDHGDVDEDRIAHLIAAKTNYEIALINSQEDDVTSFTAGDVSISEDAKKRVELAKEIYTSAMEDAGDLIRPFGFDFRSV